ncbi:magnesium chelatase subunit D [Thalassococcus sp. CAU 1522]|uniref:Magnesium chelatase subunit D n=1 Tax=Thalassococcus arenae TaxID=2851652 RepID=A0ABS6N6J1_9RHOB|nr:magnesium chelatase subunit D [Thalassococcus arenae]MBV2359398.1 magnesium chelatase subunit D [Thalassococcus arenae]
MIDSAAEIWIAGHLARALLAVDPAGLGGLHLRARASATRDAFLRSGVSGPMPGCRISPSIDDSQLLGGVDIAATLAKGRLVLSRGLLAGCGTLTLATAERCSPGLAARLAQRIDSGHGPVVIVLDEGAEESEAAPPSLTERLAFLVDLDGIRLQDMAEPVFTETDITSAQDRLADVIIPDHAVAAITVAAARFGIASMRAPLFALRAARAHAALSGRPSVISDDLAIAAQLVLAHRATCMPDDAADDLQDPGSPENRDSCSDGPLSDLPKDMLVEAVRAVLPPRMLKALVTDTPQPRAAGNGSGNRKRGNRRGRPLPARPGKPHSGARIDVIATLRAAAPWQTLRRKAPPDRAGLLLRPSDIHLKRYEERSDRLIVFAVDASGSSAMARLAETKGAVELLLAEAYAQRDHVALIAFRGTGAEMVLPPTRSLVQTKRRLAGLPGGGGTPLAAGLQASADIMRRARDQGLSPVLALLTDGRANVPLPGRNGRAAAIEDAERMALQIRELNIASAVVDTGIRPQRDLQNLAATLGACYLPLPRADARTLSKAIGSAIGA